MIKAIVTTALLLAFVSGSEGSAQQTGIGYKPATDADSKKTILLKDFQPEPALHAAAHEIRRAKFPVIDVHTHTNDAVGIGDRVDPKEMVARMDRLNIRTIVILTGMWGDKLQTIIDDMVKPYPGRFIVFTQFDWSKINDPHFSQLMVRQIDDSVARGARGLKLLKELGLGVRDSTGKLITIDDPRLDPVWAYAAEVALPVVLHAGHAADGHTDDAELEPVAEVARRHPGARVIIAHCGHTASQAALRLVARHEHVYADLTPVIHHPVRPTAAQLTALAGKLLFGSDAPNTGLTVTELLVGLVGPDLPEDAWVALTGGTARRLICDIRA